LITVSCHEDLTASDLVGRYLLQGAETVWIDGPLTRAARNGAMCYLDEIVEARKDTTVLIHAGCCPSKNAARFSRRMRIFC
jgi:nitric oxide reductase NorQ protein